MKSISEKKSQQKWAIEILRHSHFVCTFCTNCIYNVSIIKIGREYLFFITEIDQNHRVSFSLFLYPSSLNEGYNYCCLLNEIASFLRRCRKRNEKFIHFEQRNKNKLIKYTVSRRIVLIQQSCQHECVWLKWPPMCCAAVFSPLCAHCACMCSFV